MPEEDLDGNVRGLDLLSPDVRAYAERRLAGHPQEIRSKLVFQEGMDARDVELYLDESWEAYRAVEPREGERALCVMLMCGLHDDSGRQLADAVRASDFDEVHVFIHSPGGLIHEGRLMYEALRNTRRPVYTYALSDVDSAAMYPFMAGDFRFVDRHSSFLFHPPRATFANGGSLTKLDAMETARGLRKDILYLAEICTRRAGLPRARVRDWQSAHTRLIATKAQENNIATHSVPSISTKLMKMRGRMVWVGIGERTRERKLLFRDTFVRTKSAGPQLRTIVALAIATLAAKWDNFVRPFPPQPHPMRGLICWIWERKFLGAVIVIMLALAFATARPGKSPITPYECQQGSDAQACEAAWAIYGAFEAGDPAAKPPVGAIVETARADQFSIERLRLSSSNPNAPLIDQYRVGAILPDGKQITVFEAVISSKESSFVPEPLRPRISMAAWRTEEPFSYQLKRSVELSFARMSASPQNVDPGLADLRRAAEISDTLRRLPALLAPPPIRE